MLGTLKSAVRILAVKLALCLISLHPSLIYSDSKISARVLNNNAVELNGEKFILYGAVVPTSKSKCGEDNNIWPCGARATLTLHKLLKDEQLACEPVKSNGNKPFIRCSVDEIDLAEKLVSEGLALNSINSTEYQTSEKSAQSRQVGIWRDGFVPPVDWRFYPTLIFDPYADLGCSDCAIRKQ